MAMRSTSVRRRMHLLGWIAVLVPVWGGTETSDGKWQSNVAFSHYSPFASNAELARRLLSPATLARLQLQIAKSGSTLSGQPIDLTAERFSVYVPNQAPPHGYGLLVFVPPWQQAGLPQGWGPVLDRHGIIFVTAARSGNSENTMTRREPLALLAARNVMIDYPVDPERIYIGGFSGGSRIAERLAIGYPDLFRGAILNAGSSAIGDVTAEPPIPLPPRDLFMKFQEDTHLVFVTGERDEERVNEDRLSQRSMGLWCAFNTEAIVEPRLDHTVAEPPALERALNHLESGTRSDAAKLSPCRADIDAELDEALAKAQSLIAEGKRAAADKLLSKIDGRFGGLAAPRSLQLAGQ